MFLVIFMVLVCRVRVSLWMIRDGLPLVRCAFLILRVLSMREMRVLVRLPVLWMMVLFLFRCLILRFVLSVLLSMLILFAWIFALMVRVLI